MRYAAFVIAVCGLPGIAQAQAYKCAVPSDIPRPRPDLASPEQPRRVLPIGGYTLALSWAPQYCRTHARDATARFQCASGNRFGFTLHGLWPDGVGRQWPQYCAPTGILPRPIVRRHLCATPSAQLLQHEWAKHGTCMRTTPGNYFERATGLYARLRYPDMDAASRQPMTAGRFATLFAAANPGMSAKAIRVTTTRQGWLDEVWLCLDRRFAYERCRAGSGGVAASSRLRIWRGRT